MMKFLGLNSAEEKIHGHIATLKNSSYEYEKVRAANALAQLKFKKHKNPDLGYLLAVEYRAILITYMDDKNTKIRKPILEILDSLAVGTSTSDGKKLLNEIAIQNGISRLITLLNDSDKTISGYAVRLLGELARKDDNYNGEIQAAGVVRTLVLFLKDPDLWRDAIFALEHITARYNYMSGSHVLKEEIQTICKPLIDLFNSHFDGVSIYGQRVLCLLAYDAESRALIAEFDGIQIFYNLLRITIQKDQVCYGDYIYIGHVKEIIGALKQFVRYEEFRPLIAGINNVNIHFLKTVNHRSDNDIHTWIQEIISLCQQTFKVKSQDDKKHTEVPPFVNAGSISPPLKPKKPTKPEKPKKIEPAPTISLLMQRGIAFYDQNNHAEALKCFRQVIDIEPHHVDAWCHKGIVEHVLAQFTDALASYSQATRLNPMLINGLLGKARMQSYLGNSLESLATYSQIISIESQHQEALYERGQLLQQINISAIQESQRDVFERTKQNLESLMKQHEVILASGLDAKLQHYLRLQQTVLAEHNALTQQGSRALVEKIIMAHGTHDSVGIDTKKLQQAVSAALAELANLKYQLEIQCNKTLTQEQILNKLNIAFGDEAEQRVRFQSFKEELKLHPAWAVFFIEFVIGFSSKIESARLLQSGYFDLAASQAEQGVGLIGSLASGLPGIGGLASIGAQGAAMGINMYRQKEIAKGIKHIDIVTTDVARLSQELCCLIIRHYNGIIDSVYRVSKVSAVGKLSLGLFSATDEEVRLRMGQKLVREAAKKAVDYLVEYLQSSELTSGPIVNQLLTVIECHTEQIFGAQHLMSKTSDRKPEATSLSPAGTRQILNNANELRVLKDQVELLQKQSIVFREKRGDISAEYGTSLGTHRFVSNSSAVPNNTNNHSEEETRRAGEAQPRW